jgi:hypothetical protein
MSDKPTPIDSTGLTIWETVWKCGLDLEINDQTIMFTRGQIIVATIPVESIAWKWLRDNGYIK